MARVQVEGWTLQVHRGFQRQDLRQIFQGFTEKRTDQTGGMMRAFSSGPPSNAVKVKKKGGGWVTGVGG